MDEAGDAFPRRGKNKTPKSPDSEDIQRVEIKIKKDPLAAWFLGPKAEHGDIWHEMLNYIFQDYIHWRRNYFPEDPVVVDRIRRREHEHWFDRLNTQVDTILNKLKAHFPFYSPRYVAHMLSEQTLPSVLGYFAGMLYNPNNVTDEAAPVTVPLELEVGKMVAKMLGYNPHTSWSHICSGGTLANTEALWVARAAQFNGFIVQEFCNNEDLAFGVDMPNGEREDIRRLSAKALLHLNPTVLVKMFRELQKFVARERRDLRAHTSRFNDHLKTSRYNVNLQGISNVLKTINLEPKIFVSEAAHYSIKKAANVLGYGENAVELIPVDAKFRINTTALEERLTALNPNEYIAAVIGIVGTTEEGAVDPIYDIKLMRDRLSAERNVSFWFHVDAAWGGYIRSLFILPLARKKVKERNDIGKICEEYAAAMHIEETINVPVSSNRMHSRKQNYKQVTLKWNDYGLYKSFLSIPNADSITIDPHKLGYIPYPAGIVNYKHIEVTQLIKQEAQYISDEQRRYDPHELEKELEKPISVTAIGPYILEGSKPGAAAAACWLAHKTIPLELRGHGKIMRTSLLNTMKFVKYLHYHRLMFKSLDEQSSLDGIKSKSPFTFIPIYEPDTNVVCFIAHPMVWQNQKLQTVDTDLSKLNAINERLYGCLTIKNSPSHAQTPYAQDYFVSRTWIRAAQYKYDSVKEMLQSLNVTETAYNAAGLFVLRSTIMNPWHYPAELVGKNYLLDFVRSLHGYTKNILDDINGNSAG